MERLELPDGGWWDWEIMSWSSGCLRLAADTDLTYHHGLELVFRDVSYVACPSLFHHPWFRAPTGAERAHVRRYVGDRPAVLVAFDIDGPGPLPCLIAADRVEVVAGTVYRYHRADLKPGERLADWLAPS
ncbi:MULTISPECIES: hypothetical protein [unclassified Micromonospora]|uniref:hypothetical protein n=1 Tax=unclassified Micromonospora TaxID=2617518 RepID=UPI002FEEE519